MVSATAAAADGKPVRIGWLKIQHATHTPKQLAAFRAGLNALGLVEGRDFVLEERYAGGDEAKLAELAAELVRAGVAMIVATSQPSIAAASRVTRSVPIIGRMIDDPVANGMARSLSLPGGNVSGIYSLTEEMNSKRLELLRAAVPALRRVGVLLRQDWPNAARSWLDATSAARSIGIELEALDARSPEDLAGAFEQASRSGLSGIMTFRNHTVVTHYKLICDLCLRYRLPAVFDAREYVEAGGLMSYGPNVNAIYHRLGVYAEKLLRGTPAGNIPIEQPTTLELSINKRTADLIGLALPTTLLMRADDLIE